MPNNNNFAVFILSHGRPDKIKTLRALKKAGYSGKTYIICDNEDTALDEYNKRHGDMVIVFDKAARAEKTDAGINDGKRNSVLFARNECWDIATKLGLTYFLVLDDDYQYFGYRHVVDRVLKLTYVRNADRLFDLMLNFLDVSGALSVCLLQEGDFIGGSKSRRFREGISRKAMNVWFCRTDRPFRFVGKLNDDVNTYVTLGYRGNLFFSIAHASVMQTITQRSSGGLTEAYLELGTYIKSFYTVMMMPNAVRVAMMGPAHKRLHHQISWKHCVPAILSDKYRKEQINED